MSDSSECSETFWNDEFPRDKKGHVRSIVLIFLAEDFDELWFLAPDLLEEGTNEKHRDQNEAKSDRIQGKTDRQHSEQFSKQAGIATVSVNSGPNKALGAAGGGGW
jgi:hypothetical protein